jgi:hypothetical protein
VKKILVASLLLGLPLFARAASPEESPKTQVVDLDKLEIEGRVPSPSTLFIRERTTGSCYELFPLRRELPNPWLLPVDKSDFDRETWDLAGTGAR